MLNLDFFSVWKNLNCNGLNLSQGLVVFALTYE